MFSVAPTEAGERLLAPLAPMLHDLNAAVTSLGELRDRPSGTIRLTTVEHAAKTILVPAMKRLLADNPDIKVEITVDYGLADVVADRFDAGIRLGREIAKDMITIRIGPDIPMAIVGSPAGRVSGILCIDDLFHASSKGRGCGPVAEIRRADAGAVSRLGSGLREGKTERRCRNASERWLLTGVE